VILRGLLTQFIELSLSNL